MERCPKSIPSTKLDTDIATTLATLTSKLNERPQREGADTATSSAGWIAMAPTFF